MPSGHQIGPEKASSRLALVSADEREEQALLLAFSHGDVSAFETLFHLHQKAVFGWVLRIVRNPAAAEEITVESFWRIFRAHARLDPSRGFEPWARRIATHAALDHLRKQKPETDLSYEVPAPALADPAMTAEIRRKTAQAFARLPPKLRVAATLAVIEQLPHKEIAEALGITVAAVKLRVFRALRILRKDLAQQGIKP